MIWLNPADPRTAQSVIEGKWCGGTIPPVATPHDVDGADIDPTAILALEIASELLLRLSGYLVHPAGVAEEDFIATPEARRLSPNWRPIREILSVNCIDESCGLNEVLDGFCIHSQCIWFSESKCSYGAYAASSGYPSSYFCGPEVLRVQYRFGSTITAASRRAVLFLAQQLWLECNPDQGECQLPERTTSVNREGLSYTIFDPQGFLEQRRTGIPSIDLWLTAVNPGKAMRPAGVWTPDAPPAVNHTVRWTKPVFVNPLPV